jgi:hypothetical protein
MRDVLIDIVRHTNSLFTVVKVTGTSAETRLQAVDKDKVLFFEANTTAPIAEFEGVFGITNLSMLKGLLEFTSYRTDAATFDVKRREQDGVTTVEQFEFRDAHGVGADFRCMNPKLIPDQAEIRNIPWDVTLTPNKAKLAELQQIAQLFSENKTFGAKTENGNLLLYIGDDSASTNRVSMVFETDVSGELKGDFQWVTAQFLSVVKMAGDRLQSIRFSSRGVLGLEVESQHGQFKYFLRASRS